MTVDLNRIAFPDHSFRALPKPPDIYSECEQLRHRSKPEWISSDPVSRTELGDYHSNRKGALVVSSSAAYSFYKQNQNMMNELRIEDYHIRLKNGKKIVYSKKYQWISQFLVVGFLPILNPLPSSTLVVLCLWVCRYSNPGRSFSFNSPSP